MASRKTTGKHRGLKILGIVLLCLVLLAAAAGGGAYLYLRHLYNGFLDPDTPDVVKQAESFTPELEVPAEDFMPEGAFDPAPAETSAPEEAEEAEETEEPDETAKETAETTAPVFITEQTVPVDARVETVPIYQKDPIDKNVINVLFVGVDIEDFEKSGGGRSDSMIVISYNKETGKVKLHSFMRDCLVPIEGCGWTKLNHSYAYGRIGLTINTINGLFGLDIQKYAIVDWSGLREIVDYLGGLDIYLTEEEANYYGGKNLVAGVNHLNGTRVMQHVRNRTIGSDYQRTRRQRDVLIALYDKITGTYGLSDIADFFTFASGAVKTNISFEMMLSYAAALYADKNAISIESFQVPYEGTYEGGWYNCTEGWLSVVKIDIAANREKVLAALYPDP